MGGQKIYKLFSKQSVEGDVDQLFVGVTDVQVKVRPPLPCLVCVLMLAQEWEYTFPVLTPDVKFQPIILGENIFYLNTMESVASAIEGSVIAGRNIAQLIMQQQSSRWQL